MRKLFRCYQAVQFLELPKRLNRLLLPVFLGLLAIQPVLTTTTRLWTGGGANANWSTAANWNPADPPQNGDDLEFVDGAAGQSNNNDISGGLFRTLIFTGSDSTYTLSGNTITLSNGVSGWIQSSLEPVINFLAEKDVQSKYIPALSLGWRRSENLIRVM